MYEHKIIKSEDKAIWILQKDWRGLCAISEGKMYFKKEIKKTRAPAKPKEPQKEVTKYFHENIVKWLCSFYKDLEEPYFDWVRVRAKSWKFAIFSDVSEKSAWKKLWSFPKPVAERMLENAWASCYWKLFDLNEWETSKILEPLRQAKQKVERKREWFSTDEEKKQAEGLRNRIEDYIDSHPELRTQAKEYVFNLGLNMNPQATEKMIQTRCAMLAKKQL